MTYFRFMFPLNKAFEYQIKTLNVNGINFPITIEEFAGTKYVVIYAEKVMIKERNSSLPQAQNDTQVIIEAVEGLEKTLIKVCTNMTADMIIDSKDAEVKTIAKGFLKIKCGVPEEPKWVTIKEARERTNEADLPNGEDKQ